MPFIFKIHNSSWKYFTAYNKRAVVNFKKLTMPWDSSCEFKKC